MRSFSRIVKAQVIIWLVLAYGCALIPDEMAKKSPPVGLIATPPSYYSTAKARYLGQKYQENLSRLVEKIVRNPKTANLQFANNIASVGGIGFFSHSAAKVPDERYLEVILVAPETFERKGDYSAKVHRLFALYGSELLEIISSDGDIYREKEVAGYGLNLSWRTITAETTGPRVVLERAIAYFPKEEVRRFLKKEVVESNLLRDGVIFVAEGDGPMNLVSYSQQERKPDFRPPIQEAILAAGQIKPQAKTEPVVAPIPQPSAQTDANTRVEPSEIVAKGATAQPELFPKPLTPQNESTGMSDKPANSGVVASSPAAAREATKKVSAPEERVTDQSIIQKPNRPVFGGADSPELKSSVPTEPYGLPAQQTSSAPSRTTGSRNQPKDTATTVQQQASAKVKSPSAGGQATSKQAKKTEALSTTLSRGATAPDAADAVEPTRSPSPAASKSALKAAPTGTGSTLTAKTPTAMESKVDAPRAGSKPEVKSAEKNSRVPSVAARPKTVPFVSPSLESTRQAKPSEGQSAPQRAVKEEARGDASAPRMQTKTDEKKHPASSPLVPGLAAPAVQTGKVETPQLPKSVETEISAGSRTAAVAPRLSAEKVAVVKKRMDAPAPPAVGFERPVAEKNLPLPPAAKQTVDKPVKQELALLTNRPSPKAPEVKSSTRSAPKMLKGYIIQIAFTDEAMAQHWAETLERRGYAVSLTKAGSSGSLRVRIGNFPVRDEAERKLRSLGRDGLSGIILNLPDGYRPTEGAPTAADYKAEAAPAARQ